VKIFADLSLGAHGALDDDLLGDAYEYLMRHFASESGKSKGQFYTPSEVSLLLSLLLGIDGNTRQDKSIYDPTCGSGSLLLKASSLAGKKGLTIYGQEKDISTTALCKMNMILHHSADADIAKGGSSTLSNPLFTTENGMLKTFDYVVANPPFSLKNWTDGLSIDPKSKQVINDSFNRFEDGTPPEKNGDFAFLLHIIKSLKNTGKGAVILPHGVLFRGNAEMQIRKNLLTKGYIKGVIDSVDFNDNTKLGEGKAMTDALSNLVKIFADLSLGAHGALDDDLLGDAYEYLMRHFASESGKSKGQFYTPSEVS
ncbi:N-6 DNA methylase, partial [Helicobacter pylori]|uniref:N-6 DNA methylase n=1 Tax=Helicobacter pylori TaxID=210 RepID=UPI0018EDA97C